MKNNKAKQLERKKKERKKERKKEKNPASSNNF